MNARMLWSQILTVLGGIAMLLGAVDPLEGSLLVLPGSAFFGRSTEESRRGSFSG